MRCRFDLAMASCPHIDVAQLGYSERVCTLVPYDIHAEDLTGRVESRGRLEVSIGSLAGPGCVRWERDSVSPRRRGQTTLSHRLTSHCLHIIPGVTLLNPTLTAFGVFLVSRFSRAEPVRRAKHTLSTCETYSFDVRKHTHVHSHRTTAPSHKRSLIGPVMHNSLQSPSSTKPSLHSTVRTLRAKWSLASPPPLDSVIADSDAHLGSELQSPKRPSLHPSVQAFIQASRPASSEFTTSRLPPPSQLLRMRMRSRYRCPKSPNERAKICFLPSIHLFEHPIRRPERMADFTPPSRLSPSCTYACDIDARTPRTSERTKI
ncbi:hypothetical protein C8R43DRAFT_1148381 [Mycena crocata]|nr:hypothetical protein C8R43DRAFT_1148381 [Mycena crocata]